MKIGELAKKSGIAVETIRYYEKEGLIPEPSRTENNYRQYNHPHLERLLFIRNCRSFDMTHSEIRELISATDVPMDNCDPINVIVSKHIQHIDIRIHELMSLKKTLSNLQATCESNHTIHNCTILEGLASLPVSQQKKRKTHIE